MEPVDYSNLLPILGPVYQELILILLRKSQYPHDNSEFSSEDKETFRWYRQDVADTLVTFTYINLFFIFSNSFIWLSLGSLYQYNHFDCMLIMIHRFLTSSEFQEMKLWEKHQENYVKLLKSCKPQEIT